MHCVDNLPPHRGDCAKTQCTVGGETQVGRVHLGARQSWRRLGTHWGHGSGERVGRGWESHACTGHSGRGAELGEAVIWIQGDASAAEPAPTDPSTLHPTLHKQHLFQLMCVASTLLNYLYYCTWYFTSIYLFCALSAGASNKESEY